MLVSVLLMIPAGGLQKENLPAITITHLMVGCQGYSVKEFVDACIKVTGANIKVEYGSRRPGDYAEVFSDPSKAKQELVRGRFMMLVVAVVGLTAVAGAAFRRVNHHVCY